MCGHIRRSISHDRRLLIVSLEARALMQDLMEQLTALPGPMIHIAHAAMASALMQGLNDPAEGESVDLQWQLSGPFGNLYARSADFGKLRATATHLNTSVESLDTDLGRGIFQVLRVKGQQPTQGLVDSVGHVNQDVEQYFFQSEQKKCAVGLSFKMKLNENADKDIPIDVDFARGYLVHVIADEDKEAFEMRLEAVHEHLQTLGPLSEWVIDDDPALATLTMAKFIDGSQQVKSLNDSPLEIFCGCSREKIMNTLGGLTRGEKQHLLADDEKIQVECKHCGKSYEVEREEVEK